MYVSRNMKTTLIFVSMLLSLVAARATDVEISKKEPIVVQAPDGWKSSDAKPPGPPVPFETIRIAPEGGRNAECLISVLGKGHHEFKEADIMKTVLRGECLPYLSDPDEAGRIEVKEIPIRGGIGFYADFIDPDLVGKPVKQGSFKTATPMLIAIGSDYLIKITIFCDDLKGADYKEAFEMVKSIKVVQPSI